MAVSTIPAFKAALYAAVAADPSIVTDRVLVTYGAPLPNPAREFVWLADVTGNQDWANLGINKVRDEHYVLDVIVHVLREGPDQQACTERCFTIAGYIENVLRADYTVSGTVIYAGFGDKVDLAEAASDTARGATLTVGVAVRARI